MRMLQMHLNAVILLAEVLSAHSEHSFQQPQFSPRKHKLRNFRSHVFINTFLLVNRTTILLNTDKWIGQVME